MYTKRYAGRVYESLSVYELVAVLFYFWHFKVDQSSAYEICGNIYLGVFW